MSNQIPMLKGSTEEACKNTLQYMQGEIGRVLLTLSFALNELHTGCGIEKEILIES